MIERPLPLTLDFVVLAAHLGMYYMKQNRPADALKSLVMIGSMGRKFPLFAVHRRFYCLAASWVGLVTAQQYTAAKHGVLGLMRSLDPVVDGENIRTACIHPWFTGEALPFFLTPTHLS